MILVSEDVCSNAVSTKSGIALFSDSASRDTMGQTGEEYSDKARKVNEVIGALSHHFRREVVHYFENCTSDEPAALED